MPYSILCQICRSWWGGAQLWPWRGWRHSPQPQRMAEISGARGQLGNFIKSLSKGLIERSSTNDWCNEGIFISITKGLVRQDQELVSTLPCCCFSTPCQALRLHSCGLKLAALYRSFPYARISGCIPGPGEQGQAQARAGVTPLSHRFFCQHSNSPFPKFFPIRDRTTNSDTICWHHHSGD